MTVQTTGPDVSHRGMAILFDQRGDSGAASMWSMATDTGRRGVPLADAIEDALSGRPGIFGIYARNLGTGETVAINADRILPAESAAKTFVLVHYARLVCSASIDPAVRIRLDGTTRYPGTGVLRYLADGLEPTLDDLAWLMIIVSDNTATAMLIAAIGGPGAVNATMRELGFPSAELNESITFEDALEGQPFSTSSPRDLAEVYTQLDDRCRAILFRQQHLIGLPRRLPHAALAADFGIRMPVRVYNKTGNGLGNFIDSGLVETDTASWVVAAMATEQTDFGSRPDDSAPAAFGEIGERLYQAWGQS
jgi:beta-lactamase class A